MSEHELISTPDAARLLGVPDAEFTRLVKALGIEAARPGTKTQPRLWHRAVIEQLNQGPEGAELRESLERRNRVRALRSELEVRYTPWRQALRLAALGLFNFNRFAKWQTCSRLRRRELYDLKDRVLQMFYELGLCQEASLHIVPAGEEQECEACDGAGRDWRDQACSDCGGRGLLPGRRSQEFVLFQFVVEGQYFEWHAPRKGVLWPFTPTEAGARRNSWKPRSGEKPVQFEEETDFLEAEAHLVFVLGKYSDEKEAQRQAERQERRERMRREGLERQARLRAERDSGSPGLEGPSEES